MTRFAGLLYSISLPEGKRVLNAPLCAMLEHLGHRNIKALLATGNVVFDAACEDARVIEAEIEDAFVKRFGRHIDFIVRHAEAWEKLVNANPFAEQSVSDPSHVAVRVMREPISQAAADLLRERAGESEVVSIVDGDPWFYFGSGIAKSRLSAVMTPKRIGVGTARNWNTVTRIGQAL